jgi:sulfite exporter TauE/SafE
MEEKINKWSDFKFAVPIALVFVILFIFLQKIGLVNLISGGNVTYSTALIIGIIASLSTCMAVVGGLVLSISATFSKGGDKVKPQIMFHVGRIVSFFILGGVIGSLGSVFTFSTVSNFILSLVVGMVMLILGIKLLDVFPWAKRILPSLPRFIGNHIRGITNFNHTLTPFLVGVATFFLPCGFTQSMQLYTLSTGTFLSGGLTMLAFALGTLPVLALISFSSFSIKNSSRSGIFFKSAGLIVILFALFNLINSLVIIGIISPIFNI